MSIELDGCLVEFVWIILRVIGYWTAYPLLKIVTWGRLRMAPLIDLPRAERIRGFDWDIWSYQLSEPRRLKAGIVSLIGLVIWVLAGWLYFRFR